jgi:hypothetical protein
MKGSKDASGPGRMEEQAQREAPPPSRGNTVTAQGQTERQVPKARSPHERDESSDSQAADNPQARRMGAMAHDDLAEGQQDTSQGQEMDATYHRVRQETPVAPADKPGGKSRGD